MKAHAHVRLPVRLDAWGVGPHRAESSRGSPCCSWRKARVSHRWAAGARCGRSARAPVADVRTPPFPGCKQACKRETPARADRPMRSPERGVETLAPRAKAGVRARGSDALARRPVRRARKPSRARSHTPQRELRRSRGCAQWSPCIPAPRQPGFYHRFRQVQLVLRNLSGCSEISEDDRVYDRSEITTEPRAAWLRRVRSGGRRRPPPGVQGCSAGCGRAGRGCSCATIPITSSTADRRSPGRIARPAVHRSSPGLGRRSTTPDGLTENGRRPGHSTV